MATLHLLCGKIAAGKSTLAAELAVKENAILLSEDVWTAALWPGELTSIDDYRDRSVRLRRVLKPHITDVLEQGVSVVLDFAANTIGQREGLKKIADDAGAKGTLHFLDTPEHVCKARLRQRNRRGSHPYAPTESDFDVFTRYFVPPTDEEGFMLLVWKPDDAAK